MITLSDGTITLTLNHLLWTNRSRDKALGRERVTMGGGMYCQRYGFATGQDIILEARLQGSGLLGWFSWDQVLQLMLWRDAATRLVLTYDTEVRSCVIPLSGIDIEPVFSRSRSIDPAARCSGTLSLKEV